MARTFTDEQLIERLKNEDKSALFGLYDRYSHALYGVILRICRKENLAEDLLQETFLKIWQKIHLYDPNKGRFYTWAYRIAKNTTLNSLRNTSDLIQNRDLSVYESNREAETPTDYTELSGSIEKLETHHQEALELVYYKGLTHREAHEEMGVPLGTFKSYVRQALRQLRETYQKEFFLVWILIETIG
ncbi:MAG: sigma-70 family RNA polymerase sigma factor [Saonia sp.]